MTKLKPCPFCGGEATIVQHIWIDGLKKTYNVVCTKCKTESSALRYESKEDAAVAWNRRANDERTC